MKLAKILIYSVMIGFILYLVINLAMCVLVGSTKVEYIPEKDVWFCEELQLQLSFEEGYDCYYVCNGTKIGCTWENDPGSRAITVLCQNDDSDTYSVGGVIFCGNCIELTEDQLIIEEMESGVCYVFLRGHGYGP